VNAEREQLLDELRQVNRTLVAIGVPAENIMPIAVTWTLDDDELESLVRDEAWHLVRLRRRLDEGL
jgi:hypothetical protein